MRIHYWATLLVVSAVLGGCGGRSGGSAGDAARGSASAQQIRAKYQALNPANQVGVVTDVRRDLNLAAVSEMPLDQFPPGTVIVFIDTDEKPLGSGTVKNVTENELHVTYGRPSRGGREPRVGDLAVRVQ